MSDSKSGHRPPLSALGRALRDSGTLPEGSRVLAAVSGGPDSTALLLGLAELAQAPSAGWAVGPSGWPQVGVSVR